MAHVDAGKTTLIEALLFRTGAVRSLGSVDAKSSHLDFNALEQQRGITIYAKQARVLHRGVELSLVDTPGHVDFTAEAERTLTALDLAVLVVDAHEGVRGHTETLWRLLERHGVPVLVFGNKTDLAEAGRAELMAHLRALTRRKGEVEFETLKFADVVLNLQSFDLGCREKTIHLSFKEFQMMRVLMANPGMTVAKETLIEKVWGASSGAEDNNVEAYVSFLRKKLAFLGSSVQIETLRRAGYRLVDTAAKADNAPIPETETEAADA